MTALPIVMYDPPILREPSRPVADFDHELRELIQDLTETMNEHNGAGLAAPQIGLPLRVFTFSAKLADGALGHPGESGPRVPDEEEQDGPEGRLSIPGVYFETMRRNNVIAKGYSAYGDPLQIVDSSMLARCIQHETDHLDGVLFFDRIDGERRARTLDVIRHADWRDGDGDGDGDGHGDGHGDGPSVEINRHT